MTVFDIIGPIMVGPSSSHTAGAVKIGYITRNILAEEPVKANIVLSGSFAATGKGHGTDTALIAGLLGMKTSDMDIPNSFLIAKERGLEFSFASKDIKDAHPNTAVIDITGNGGRHLIVQASSIGGGRIMVNKLDEIEVNFSGEMNTLVVHNNDLPGNVCNITQLLKERNINIATMQLYRKQRGGFAVMTIETDQEIPCEVIEKAEKMPGIIKASYLKKIT